MVAAAQTAPLALIHAQLRGCAYTLTTPIISPMEIFEEAVGRFYTTETIAFSSK
jgi:hypothetical protein